MDEFWSTLHSDLLPHSDRLFKRGLNHSNRGPSWGPPGVCSWTCPVFILHCQVTKKWQPLIFCWTTLSLIKSCSLNHCVIVLPRWILTMKHSCEWWFLQFYQMFKEFQIMVIQGFFFKVYSSISIQVLLMSWTVSMNQVKNFTISHVLNWLWWSGEKNLWLYFTNCNPTKSFKWNAL